MKPAKVVTKVKKQSSNQQIDPSELFLKKL